jgi:hydroxyacylglutathione hydrolase
MDDNTTCVKINDNDVLEHYKMELLELNLLNKNIPYAIFTGDCFFNAGVGNCHNGGNPEIMFQTINQIFENFSDELIIYPGHEYLKKNLEFTLKYDEKNSKAQKFYDEVKNCNLDEVFYINKMKTEREINNFLRLKDPTLRKNLNLTGASDKQVFLTLRELRNKF